MAASVKWWIEEDLSFWRRPSKMKFDYYRSSGELFHLLQIKPILFALSHHSRIRNLRQNNFSSQDAHTLTTEIYKTATTQTQFYLRSFGNLGIGISSSSAALSSVLVYRHCENVIFPTSIFLWKNWIFMWNIPQYSILYFVNRHQYLFATINHFFHDSLSYLYENNKWNTHYVLHF